jgi:hypothetical protein
MIADHEISSPTQTTMDAEVSTCIILVLKEAKFLSFLALQRNSFIMFINCNEFHSDLISLFEKLDKNIEIGNNE